jgi:hypothetical protein
MGTNTRINRKGLAKAFGAADPPNKPTGPKTADLATIVSRLRVSYPVLTASKLDAGMRQLVLAELIEQCLADHSSVVVP